MNKVVVVTISETMMLHKNEVDTLVFDSMEKAEVWIERQVEKMVKNFQLDRESDVDGWFVQIDGWNHTIQYDAKERIVQ
ncbi:MAG: hypothetical protein MJ240_01275 [Kiritimatiellae bacterium]|nr:hypothetical protein [Kiritimatiellia bacterium]